MQTFDYLPAGSVAEAIAALAAGGAGARALGGGTDLIAQVREGRRPVARIVDLKRIPALTEIRLPGEGGAWIGAAVTCRTLSQHAEFRGRYAGMYDFTHLIGGVQTRGRATGESYISAAAGLGARVKGLRRYYAPLLAAGGKARLVKALDGETTMSETGFVVESEHTYDLNLEVNSTRLREWIDGQQLFDVEDTDLPLDGGAVALICEEGRIGATTLSVKLLSH